MPMAPVQRITIILDHNSTQFHLQSIALSVVDAFFVTGGGLLLPVDVAEGVPPPPPPLPPLPVVDPPAAAAVLAAAAAAAADDALVLLAFVDAVAAVLFLFEDMLLLLLLFSVLFLSYTSEAGYTPLATRAILYTTLYTQSNETLGRRLLQSSLHSLKDSFPSISLGSPLHTHCGQQLTALNGPYTLDRVLALNL